LCKILVLFQHGGHNGGSAAGSGQEQDAGIESLDPCSDFIHLLQILFLNLQLKRQRCSRP
jgi:hypothetical protein